MESNLRSFDAKAADQTPKVCMIGYGTFLWDAIKDLAVGIRPKVWNEYVGVLGPVKIKGYRRLWPGKPNYPIIQKAAGYFFGGRIISLRHALPAIEGGWLVKRILNSGKRRY